MFCVNCGKKISGKFCGECGTASVQPETPKEPSLVFTQSRDVTVIAPGAPTSPMAIAAVVCAFIVPFVGIILGVIARNDIKNSRGTKAGDSLANLAIVLGGTFTALYFFFFIIFLLTYQTY